MADKTDKSNPGTVAENRQARHEYEILEQFEAGIELTGTEIKSVRASQINLRGSYARVENSQIWLHDSFIAPYQQAGTHDNHEPTRKRRLLLHRSEIRRLIGMVREKGLTLVPLRVYFKGRYAKVGLAVGRGKKLYDKREDIGKREAQRDMDRVIKRRSQE